MTSRRPFSFAFRPVHSLPPMAWCARVSAADPAVTVWHGDLVETRTDWFAEGAWDGDFQQGPDRASVLMGSGARLNSDGVVFLPPKHALERLHSIKTKDGLYVSNSLAFVLRMAGDSLRPGYMFYRQRTYSIRYGLNACARTLPTAKRNAARLHYYFPFTVNGRQDVSTIRLKDWQPFNDYHEYTEFLQSKVRQIVANGADPARTRRFSPIATVSAGYDSAASAVLAKGAGCKEVLTLDSPDDDGSEIAGSLGLHVTKRRHDEWQIRGGKADAEFYASGNKGAESFVLAWEQDIKDRILFTGMSGDYTWNGNFPHGGRYFRRSTARPVGWAGGTSLDEFRLRVGFVHVPVPYIGARSQPEIHKISNSREMLPWALHNDYDRPIPRRLVEEAGVDRSSFGMKKSGPGVWGNEGDRRKGKLSAESAEDFKRYVKSHWTKSTALTSSAIDIVRFVYLKNLAITAWANRLVRRLGLDWNPPQLLPRRIGHYVDQGGGAANLLPQWAMSKIWDRYKVE